MIIENILGQVLANFKVLLPFVVVQSNEGGCLWRFGRNPRELKPGWRVRWWFIDNAEIVTMADDAMELPTQSVITKDEKLVCFKVGFTYRVVDPVAHCCNVTDFVEATKTLAMMHLAERVRATSLNDVVADLKKLERSLSDTLTTKFADWGTEVGRVGFTDFAEVSSGIRVYQDIKAGGGTTIPMVG